MPKQIYYKLYWSVPGDGHLTAAAWCASALHSWKNRISHEKLKVAKSEKKKPKKTRENSRTRDWLMKSSYLYNRQGSPPAPPPSPPSRKVHLITWVKLWSGHQSQRMEEWSEEDRLVRPLCSPRSKPHADQISKIGINVRRSRVRPELHPIALCYSLKVGGYSMAWQLTQLNDTPLH